MQTSVSIEFGILGPLQLLVDGAPVGLGGAKQQVLLAALLMEPRRVVSVDRLVEWVWGDDDDHHATLHVYVSNLRRVLAPLGERLGRPLIETRRPGYLIEVGPDELDALRFEQGRVRGEQALHAGEWHEAVAALREALGLWRGEPLAGLPIEGVARRDVTRLEVARWTTIEQLFEAELELGRHQEVVNELRGWVSEAPLNERLRALLMLALYRCGWQADALSAYHEGRDLLVEELGIDPSRELRDLEGRILAQDPTLDVAAPASSRMVPLDATVLRTSVMTQDAHVTIDGKVVALRKGVTTIGRLPDRDLVVLDPGASRVHAEIRLTTDGYRLVDADSANGTVIDGQRVRDHLLCDGDVIRIGDAVITFSFGPAPDST